MKITKTRDEITPVLTGKQKLLAGTVLLDAAGEVAIADIQKTFDTSGANLGESWEPLSALTILWRRKGGKAYGNKPLQSSSATPFGLYKIVRANSVEVSTNRRVGGVDIAAVHHFGVKYNISKKQQGWFWYHGVHWPMNKPLEIKARRFMEVSSHGEAAIAADLVVAMERA